MSNLTEHAERELKAAGLFDEDSDYNGGLGESVMELVKLFAKQDHSGASATRTISLFKRVAGWKTLLPLTGKDDEWNIGLGGKAGHFQNKRDSAVFKDEENKPYYIHAITWKTQKGSTWGGRADDVSSAQCIKSFPFQPKTFIIDVIEEEVAKGDWKFHIKNRADLDKVWEVYDFKKVKN